MQKSCQVVHAGPGRLRVRVPGLRSRTAYARALVSYLSQQPTIDSVRPNLACDGLLLTYSQESWTAPSLADFITDALQLPAAVLSPNGRGKAPSRPRHRRRL